MEFEVGDIFLDGYRDQYMFFEITETRIDDLRYTYIPLDGIFSGHRNSCWHESARIRNAIHITNNKLIRILYGL